MPRWKIAGLGSIARHMDWVLVFKPDYRASKSFAVGVFD